MWGPLLVFEEFKLAVQVVRRRGVQEDALPPDAFASVVSIGHTRSSSLTGATVWQTATMWPGLLHAEHRILPFRLRAGNLRFLSITAACASPRTGADGPRPSSYFGRLLDRILPSEPASEVIFLTAMSSSAIGLGDCSSTAIFSDVVNFGHAFRTKASSAKRTLFDNCMPPSNDPAILTKRSAYSR
ncbi:hypothetical protein PR001_g24653 [Phytophthora rubi]|uniref:Uncharacterized protein n=1 Tax=Phytophthora rubi TaxID=129364 RepID=A0A6A3IC82_9STRA|nr:hypothetical protein PR001_g24653 [Phytophthora rubi]